MKKTLKSTTSGAREDGFILVFALVLLVLLTLFGVWGMRTSEFEHKMSGNAQQAEISFNLAEAANMTEAANLGYDRRDCYRVANVNKANQPLLPLSSAYNPRHLHDSEGYIYSPSDFNIEDPKTWPWGNLENETGSGPLKATDYRYAVYYLSQDTTPQGSGAVQFTAHKCRIWGNSPMRGSAHVVETAGNLIRLSSNQM